MPDVMKRTEKESRYDSRRPMGQKHSLSPELDVENHSGVPSMDRLLAGPLMSHSFLSGVGIKL